LLLCKGGAFAAFSDGPLGGILILISSIVKKISQIKW